MAWTGAATRTAKNLGVAPRADVKAIVDKANADTAPLRNVVIGSQAATSCATTRRGCASRTWATWWPTRCG